LAKIEPRNIAYIGPQLSGCSSGCAHQLGGRTLFDIVKLLRDPVLAPATHLMCGPVHGRVEAFASLPSRQLTKTESHNMRMSNKFLPDPLGFDRLDDFILAIKVASDHEFITLLTATSVEGEIKAKLSQIDMFAESDQERLQLYRDLIDAADSHAASLGEPDHD
jgi:hypothetical protein